MAASAATLARCLNVSSVRDAKGWATKDIAAAAIADNPVADAYRMRPIRAHNRFFLFWIAAAVLHTSDVRTVVAVLLADEHGWEVAALDAPEGIELRPDVPRLTTTLAARHLGRRLTVCNPSGDVSTIEVTGVDAALADAGYVYGRTVRTGRLFVRPAGMDAVLRGAQHRVTYSAGRQAVSDGPDSYDLSGARLERTGYFYNASCSCGQWSYSDVGDQARRLAVAAHLAEVGERA